MSFQKSDNTAGGLAKLFLLRLNHFQGVKWSNDFQSYILVGDTYNYLEQIYFTQDTGSYAVQRKKGAYNITIKASYPGSSNAFEELEGTPFLLVGLTHNKQYLLFGDANNYFIYDHNEDSGSDFSELHHTAFKLKRQMMFKPRLIRDPFVVDVIPQEVQFEVFNNSVNFSEESEGQYRLNIPYYINPSSNIHVTLFKVGPSNFQNKSTITFEVRQNFASGNFAPVAGFAKTIDANTLSDLKNHISRYNVSYSAQAANQWVTVTLEVWSDTPPYNAMEVFISTRNVGVAVNEYVQIRNIQVKTLP